MFGVLLALLPLLVDKQLIAQKVSEAERKAAATWRGWGGGCCACDRCKKREQTWEREMMGRSRVTKGEGVKKFAHHHDLAQEAEVEEKQLS